ncbi:gamma-glutamyl-gamma-aminobutyrate hydrolase family protein [candidate division KSB1 bacterium]|nr:gamma-glutamyl-gamma-aminobutyrate hydrolase family protein [candidate division KSB1 bacterium]
MKKPLIALTMDQSPATDSRIFSKGVGIYFITYDYIRHIEKVDCIPMMLPTLHDLSPIPAIVARIDGLLLTGGDDVDASAYGEAIIPGQWRIDAPRTGMEVALILEARRQKKPVYGICRGCQMLNVALGGTLYQDIPQQVEKAIQHHSSNKPQWHYHDVRIVQDTLLNRLLGQERLSVNSSHHQAIKELAPDLQVSASSSDGIIEGVEDNRFRFFLGVQWHPETMDDDSTSLALLNAFLSCCR